MRWIVCLFVTLAPPALADSPDAWEAFRAEVAAACTASVGQAGEIAVEVNPFGSESYGAAIVTVSGEWGADRMICIFDKATRTVELTAPFAPAE